jgi:acyl-coenzyme A synthetase/AMP-(fatty) acid ligase
VPRFRDEAMPALRIMQNAGGHLPVSCLRRLRLAQPQARLFLQYGLTETFRSTYLAPDEVDRHPGSIGRAIPGADILVVRDDLTSCDVGEVGELVHRGPTVAVGYWNDVEATARVFRPDPRGGSSAAPAERVVFSGDLVRRDAEGRLYFVGRRDRMIKTLGHRVAPDEVVEVLIASGEILDAVVAGEPDDERGERIVAYVTLSPAGSVKALRSFCRRELPRHMQPSRFEAHCTLPRLASGKYDLQALHAMSGDATVPHADFTEGATR